MADDYEMGAIDDDMDEEFWERRIGHSESDDDEYDRSVCPIKFLYS